MTPDHKPLPLSDQRTGTPRTIFLEIKAAIQRRLSCTGPIFEDLIFTGIHAGFGKEVFESLAEEPQIEGIAAR